MDIFVAKDETKKCLTKTSVLETIPDRTIKYDKDWKKKKLTQWKWRFLTINTRDIVEISYQKWNSNDKFYYLLDKNTWNVRTVDPVYDKYVTEEYYLYTTD